MLSPPQHNVTDPPAERLMHDVAATFARLAEAARGATRAVHELERYAQGLAAVANGQVVKIKREPPRDANGKRIRHRGPGRPKGSKGNHTLVLFASAAQIENLRAELAETPALPWQGQGEPEPLRDGTTGR